MLVGLPCYKKLGVDLMNNIEDNTYRTLKGYELKENKGITSAMEDYLEMICRCSDENGYIRINNLAAKLNVKPSSSSKMVNNLRELGFVEYEKYGIIKPTGKGMKLGRYLLLRHKIINKFFCVINQSEDELEQTEKVEHFIDQKTLCNIEKLINFLEEHDTKEIFNNDNS